MIPTPPYALEKIVKIADSSFVDLAKGTGPIEQWANETMLTYNRYTEKPDTMLMILKKKPDGQYEGTMYIKREDFVKQ
jgi:hypothetical protein